MQDQYNKNDFGLLDWRENEESDQTTEAPTENDKEAK